MQSCPGSLENAFKIDKKMSWGDENALGMVWRRRKRGIPGPRWGPPARLQPKIESAHGQETLSACSRGGGISSEWKEKAPSAPETISAPPPRPGDLQGCPGEPGGTVFPHQGVG